MRHPVLTVTNRRRDNGQRKASLKKETIRALDVRTLSLADLEQVAGAGCTWQPRYTLNCG